MADILSPGQSLQKGDSLQSQNGQYTFVLQHDGNLVLYDANQRALWASGTHGRAVSRAIMQTDGNFVIYGYPGAIWASNTNGWHNAYLIVQNDGNVVIYGSKAAWASGTNRVFYDY